MKVGRYEDPIDFAQLEVNKRVVSVDGIDLPLKIGDKIKLAENDRNIKTIMSITIFEDGRIAYTLEWYDPDSGNFSTETLTMSELKLLMRTHVKKHKEVVGFSAKKLTK